MERRVASPKESRSADRRRTYHDQGVCIDYLCGLCPIELTRGHPCGKEHNDQLRTEYELDVRQDRSKAMDKEHLVSLEKFLNLRNQDTEDWKNRLRDLAKKTPEVDCARRKLREIHDGVLSQLSDAEKLVDSGKLSDARGVLDNMRFKLINRPALEVTIAKIFTEPGNEKPELNVCETCGIFYLTSMLEAHNLSPQHIAYDEIRKAVLEIRTRLGIPRNHKHAQTNTAP